jgi:hypothetical protein
VDALLTILFVLAVLATGSPEPTRYGKATYYDRGVMEEVFANRLAMGHVKTCAECVGYAALPTPADLGKRIWVRNERTEEWRGPLLAIDCAAPGDLAAMQAGGVVVEVDFATATAWKMAGPIPVEVVFAQPDGLLFYWPVLQPRLSW